LGMETGLGREMGLQGDGSGRERGCGRWGEENETNLHSEGKGRRTGGRGGEGMGEEGSRMADVRSLQDFSCGPCFDLLFQSSLTTYGKFRFFCHPMYCKWSWHEHSVVCQLQVVDKKWIPVFTARKQYSMLSYFARGSRLRNQDFQ